VTNKEDIRAGNPIADVIGQYVTLKKSGIQFVGLCPFHKEKTGSFYVHPVKGVYHCHGCGAGGDVIRFVQEIERIDFPAALRLLAERSGLHAISTSMTPAEKQIYAEQRQERELMEHFGLVEGVSIHRAGLEYNKRTAVDPEYRAWLKADLAHAHAICGLIVGMIAIAQERDGDYAKEQAA
jgi:DNA primase catalytic core